jgi:hypothetical protein
MMHNMRIYQIHSAVSFATTQWKTVGFEKEIEYNHKLTTSYLQIEGNLSRSCFLRERLDLFWKCFPRDRLLAISPPLFSTGKLPSP